MLCTLSLNIDCAGSRVNFKKSDLCKDLSALMVCHASTLFKVIYFKVLIIHLFLLMCGIIGMYHSSLAEP